MNSIIANAKSTPQSAALSIDQTLQLAIVHHQASQFLDAKHLYLAILAVQPEHPDANHNLGVLALNINQPAAALPYLQAALKANPEQGQYWLSLIEALRLTGQTDSARWMLEQAQLRGLQGEAVKTLTRQLNTPAAKPMAPHLPQVQRSQEHALA
jgi:protein O-GlcNAc transferase